jgi:hypothetical protein
LRKKSSVIKLDFVELDFVEVEVEVAVVFGFLLNPLYQWIAVGQKIGSVDRIC